MNAKLKMTLMVLFVTVWLAGLAWLMVLLIDEKVIQFGWEKTFKLESGNEMGNCITISDTERRCGGGILP